MICGKKMPVQFSNPCLENELSVYSKIVTNRLGDGSIINLLESIRLVITCMMTGGHYSSLWHC